MLEFPRYMFQHGQVKLVNTLDEFNDNLMSGWVGTAGEDVDEAPALPVVEVEVEELLPEVDQTPPTREELEAKAHELGLKFHPNLGDARLQSMIEDALEA